MPFIGKLPDVGAFRLIDSITTSATDTYALQVEGLSYFPSSARNLIVSLNGVTQAPESAYTVSGSNIIFDSALTASDVIDYILVIGESVDIGTPSDNTVGNAQLKSDLDFSGKTLTFSADQISGDAINGGTISSFASTGIDDNATSTAITISAYEDVRLEAGSLAIPINENINFNSFADANNEIGGNGGTGYMEYAGFNGHIFYQGTGGAGVATERMRIDSSGNVGIGTNTANHKLTLPQVDGTSIGMDASAGFTLNGTNCTYYGLTYQNGTGTGFNTILSGYDNILFATLGAERLRITSNGNVGIGTASPNSRLTIAQGFDKIALNATTTQTASKIVFADSTTTDFYSVGCGSEGDDFVIYASSVGAERMRIDSAGRVTKPNQPFFHAYFDGAINITSSSQVIAFNLTATNIGSHFNTSTYRFTAPISGRYLFSVGIRYNYPSSSGGYTRFTLRKNGSLTASNQAILDPINTFSENSYQSASQVVILNVTANDYFEVIEYSQYGGGQLAGTECHFQGYLLG